MTTYTIYLPEDSFQVYLYDKDIQAKLDTFKGLSRKQVEDLHDDAIKELEEIMDYNSSRYKGNLYLMIIASAKWLK